MSVTAAAQAYLARPVCVVAMKVHVAPPAAAETLLHPRRVSVAEVGWLWNAELEAKPRDEVSREETEKGV